MQYDAPDDKLPEDPATGPGDGYSLTELTDLTGVSQRTVRYYIQQGLLPAASRGGPGARYAEDALVRLRFIRACQEEGWPLAKVRDQLERQPTEAIAAMVASFAEGVGAAGAPTVLPAAEPNAALAYLARLRSKPPGEPPKDPGAAVRGSSRPVRGPVFTRSNWERLTIDANLELHVRRPLSLAENRRLDRLLEAIEAIYGPGHV